MREELRARGIVGIGFFGSYATGRNDAYSDIAFLKASDYRNRFTGYDYMQTLLELRETLQRGLGRPVDLFDLDSQSPIKGDVEREWIPALSTARK
ncbi:nucleotidyltransferase family protein [Hydrogenimonas sp.]